MFAHTVWRACAWSAYGPTLVVPWLFGRHLQLSTHLLATLAHCLLPPAARYLTTATLPDAQAWVDAVNGGTEYFMPVTLLPPALSRRAAHLVGHRARRGFIAVLHARQNFAAFHRPGCNLRAHFMNFWVYADRNNIPAGGRRDLGHIISSQQHPLAAHLLTARFRISIQFGQHKRTLSTTPVGSLRTTAPRGLVG